MNKDNDFYMLQMWLDTNERSLAWLSRRLELHKNTIQNWKRDGIIPESKKLAICYIQVNLTNNYFRRYK